MVFPIEQVLYSVLLTVLPSNAQNFLNKIKAKKEFAQKKNFRNTSPVSQQASGDEEGLVPALLLCHDYCSKALYL